MYIRCKVFCKKDVINMAFSIILNTIISMFPNYINTVNTSAATTPVFAHTANEIHPAATITPLEEDDPTDLDPIPEPPTPTPTLVQSLEGWSCDEDYLLHKNEIMGTVSSNDPRLTYSPVYIGSSADGDPEEGYDEVFNGEYNSEYKVPAGCYGDGIGVQVEFANGVQGFAYLSRVPAYLSYRTGPYGLSEYNVTGAYPDSELLPYDYPPGFDWDYYWMHVTYMDTVWLFSNGGGSYEKYHDDAYAPIRDYVYDYTYGGMTFYLYFALFKPNSALDSPLIFNSNVPSLTFDFDFITCDYDGNPTDLEIYSTGYYSGLYITDGFRMINEIVHASGLTVLGTQTSQEGWSCNAAYMVRVPGTIGTVTNSAAEPSDATLHVYSIITDSGQEFEPYPYSTETQGCYGDGIGAHVVFANGAEGYVILSKIPHVAATHCLRFSKYTVSTFIGGPDGNEWYCDGSVFISYSNSAADSVWNTLDYEEYQAAGGESGDYHEFINYLPSITVDGIKFYMHYLYLNTSENIEFHSNVPTINLNFNCYRCDGNGNPSNYGYYYHTDRQAVMQAIVTASGLTVNS